MLAASGAAVGARDIRQSAAGVDDDVEHLRRSPESYVDGKYPALQKKKKVKYEASSYEELKNLLVK